MAKVWKDLNDLHFAEVPTNLKKYDDSMKAIPRHDNSCYGARKVYQKEEYSIYKVDNGLIIHNTKKNFENGHTHVKSFEMCKVLIDCSIRNKLPRTRNHYLLSCLIRISNNDNLKTKVKELISVRENK